MCPALVAIYCVGLLGNVTGHSSNDQPCNINEADAQKLSRFVIRNKMVGGNLG